MKGIHLFFFSIPCCLIFWSCSLQSLAIRSTGDILEYGLEAVNEESDLPLAEQSIASNLKLLDGLIKGDPDNSHFLLRASQGYTSYALGFIEDQDEARARMFYLRGRNYGLRILQQQEKFAAVWDKDFASFQVALKDFSQADVPAMFWTANAWGNYINLSKTDPAAIADLPKVEAMMEFVLNHDEKYFYGGAHLFFGTFYSSKSKSLGGEPEKARQHFEKCLSLGGGKFLLAYVFYAKPYAVQVQDRELFQKLLKKVEEASPDILPEQRLANMIAKRKAKRLLENINEYFE